MAECGNGGVWGWLSVGGHGWGECGIWGLQCVGVAECGGIGVCRFCSMCGLQRVRVVVFMDCDVWGLWNMGIVECEDCGVRG